jgi:hypothetical protein
VAEDRALAEILPPGATFDSHDLKDWSLWLGNSGRGLPFTTAEGVPDVVALRLGSPPTVVWRLGTSVLADRTAAYPAWMYSRTGTGLPAVVVAGGEPAIVTIDPSRLAIGHVLRVNSVPADARLGLRAEEIDLDGEGGAELVIQLTPYQDRAAATLVVAKLGSSPTADTLLEVPADTVISGLGDGRSELITAVDDGWNVLRLDAGEFRVVERIRGDDIPASRSPTGRPPPPAASLHLLRSSAVVRWPIAGDDVVRVGLPAGLARWRILPDQIDGRWDPPYRVAAEGGRVVYLLADPDKPRAADAFGLEADGAAFTVRIRGSIGQWVIDPHGDRGLYFGRGAISHGEQSRENYGAGDAILYSVDFRPGGGGSGNSGLPTVTTPLANCEFREWPGGGQVRCIRFAVNEDWTQVALADGHGVWIVDVPSGDSTAKADEKAPRLVLEHEVISGDGPGSKVYWPDRWSPDGRWLLLQQGGYEGSSGVVRNMESGGLIALPDSVSYGEYQAGFAFARDSGWIAIARSGVGAPLSVVNLATGAVRDYLGTAAVGARRDAFAPFVTVDGRIRFGLDGAPEVHPGRGLFELDPASGAVSRLAGMPTNSDEYGQSLIEWLPDGSALVALTGRDYDIRYAAFVADGETAIDVTRVLLGSKWPQWSVTPTTRTE